MCVLLTVWTIIAPLQLPTVTIWGLLLPTYRFCNSNSLQSRMGFGALSEEQLLLLLVGVLVVLEKRCLSMEEIWKFPTSTHFKTLQNIPPIGKSFLFYTMFAYLERPILLFLASRHLRDPVWDLWVVVAWLPRSGFSVVAGFCCSFVVFFRRCCHWLCYCYCCCYLVDVAVYHVCCSLFC